MFSLLVTMAEGAWDGRHHQFGPGRFLEFTAADLKERYGGLDEEAVAAIRAMPALFMYEDTVAGDARIGRILDVKRRNGDVRVSFELDADIPPIDPSKLSELDWDLEIEGAESSRTHWAVKNVDLMAVLKTAGLVPPGRTPPSRREILDAAKRLQAIGHSDFDRMILELGVPGLKAGRELGGLLARSNALGQFAIEQPDVLTAEGVPLGVAVIDQADARAPVPEPSASDVEAASFSTPIEAAAEPPRPERSLPTMTSTDAAQPRIFVVHGRDNGAKHEVARFIDNLGLKAVILHEEANRGRSLIAKFTEVAGDIVFAVVLMTPDDTGALKGAEPAQRARQNVVFELGFFIGKLGSEKVCALVPPEVERPSDFESIVYVPFGEGTNWRAQLAKEFDAAGIAFDPKKVW